MDIQVLHLRRHVHVEVGLVPLEILVHLEVGIVEASTDLVVVLLDVAEGSNHGHVLELLELVQVDTGKHLVVAHRDLGWSPFLV